jgi:predicted CoA-binding protein
MSDASEMPSHYASPEEIQSILKETRTIAVVGLSNKPDRDSYRVAAYMQQQGYRILPVNPAVEEVLGEKAYASLEEIPEPIDLVNVFRRPEHVPPLIDSAIAIAARGIWLQLGIVSNASLAKARQAGLRTVQNRCLMVEHRRFA